MSVLARKFLGLLRWLGTGWSILGLTFLLIAVGELGLRGVFWLKDRASPLIPPDPRVVAAIEGSSAWLPTHYRELETVSDRWQPYVYFRQRPFRGQTITIDGEGLRATWKPPDLKPASDNGSRPLRLLLLGGSSLWGFGARDDATIPSFLTRTLFEQGVAVEVRNLAEIGYVSTQELVALIRELQNEYRPDVVLFYDGVNDTTSALLERQPAVTTNEANRVREFNLLQSPSRLTVALGSRVLRDSAWFRLAASIGRRFSRTSAADPRSLTESDLRQLARGVVDRYAANVRLVRALGAAYGFRALFAWQPVIFGKPALVPFEREESEKFGWTRDMFQHVRQEIARHIELNGDPLFLDLGSVFEHDEPLVFLDFCHTTEAANARIAARLAEKLIAVTRDDGPERGTSKDTTRSPR